MAAKTMFPETDIGMDANILDNSFSLDGKSP